MNWQKCGGCGEVWHSVTGLADCDVLCTDSPGAWVKRWRHWRVRLRFNRRRCLIRAWRTSLISEPVWCAWQRRVFQHSSFHSSLIFEIYLGFLSCSLTDQIQAGMLWTDVWRLFEITWICELWIIVLYWHLWFHEDYLTSMETFHCTEGSL